MLRPTEQNCPGSVVAAGSLDACGENLAKNINIGRPSPAACLRNRSRGFMLHDRSQMDFRRGDLIVLSKPFAYVLSNELRGKRCDYCFVKNEQLKRCAKCSFLYFCDKNCQAKAWDFHKTECKYIEKASPKTPTASLRLISLILFKIKKNGWNEPYEEVHGHKMTFQRLMSHAEDIRQDIKTCQQMTALLGTIKEYIGIDNTPPPVEFIKIFGRMCINTFSICDGEMQSIGSGLYLGASIFDHSCTPDAEVVFDGTNLSIRAVCDIPHRNVQKVYISYIEQLQLTKDRQDYLREHYYFECKCRRCVSTYYDNMMTRLLVFEEDPEALVTEVNRQIADLKEMKKNKVRASTIYEKCIQELEKIDQVFDRTHICIIKLLEIAFDACIENNAWPDAIAIGNNLTEPYNLYYEDYHPLLGIHLFKLGKIQNFLGLRKSAKKNLIKAEEILKVTHGIQHPLYCNLLEILKECKVES